MILNKQSLPFLLPARLKLLLASFLFLLLLIFYLSKSSIFKTEVAIGVLAPTPTPHCTHLFCGSCSLTCSPICPANWSPCSQCNCGLPLPGETCPGGGCSSQCNLTSWDGRPLTGGLACCCPNPTPTPTPIPKKCSKVYGYVKNSSRVDYPGIAGAKITAHGINNSVGRCQGGHTGCTVATSGRDGYFEITCNSSMNCLGVYESQNAVGYKDSLKFPIGPPGTTSWGVNQIMWNNPSSDRCGPFIFYDTRLN